VWRFLLAGSQQKTPHFHFRAPAAHERREWESPVPQAQKTAGQVKIYAMLQVNFY